MLQFTRISQVVQVSRFMYVWNGTNQEYINGLCIKTSNRLLSKYHNKGEDSLINSVTLKQLMTYDYQALLTMLASGIIVRYQTQSLTISLIKSNLKVVVENLKTSDVHTYKISKTNINKLSRIVLNVDSVDVLQAIYNRMVAEGL